MGAPLKIRSQRISEARASEVARAREKPLPTGEPNSDDEFVEDLEASTQNATTEVEEAFEEAHEDAVR